MGVNSLPKTVTRQSRGCDLNPGCSVPESSTQTTRLPSHPEFNQYIHASSYASHEYRLLLHIFHVPWSVLGALASRAQMAKPTVMPFEAQTHVHAGQGTMYWIHGAYWRYLIIIIIIIMVA